jgi:hypothetical protein
MRSQLKCHKRRKTIPKKTKENDREKKHQRIKNNVYESEHLYIQRYLTSNKINIVYYY